METIIMLIQNYGYAIVFLLTLLEGETVVALAGFAAEQGHLRLFPVIIVAILGASIGDQLFFYFGRLKGKRYLARRPHLTERVDRIHLLLERHQSWIIFSSRFMYGFRMVIPIALGTSGVKASKFFLFNLAGAIVWGIFFSVGGYVFGGAIETFLGHVKRAEKFIIFGVLLGAFIASAIVFLRRRITDEIEKSERALEDTEIPKK